MLFLHVLIGMLVQEPMEAKGIGAPGARVTDYCDLLHTRTWDKQQVLSTTKPSLQTQKRRFVNM